MGGQRKKARDQSGRAEQEDAAPHAVQEAYQLEPATGAGLEGGRAVRKSKFVHVYWDYKTKAGSKGYYGQLGATSKHPALRTPQYDDEEEAARAVDR